MNGEMRLRVGCNKQRGEVIAAGLSATLGSDESFLDLLIV